MSFDTITADQIEHAKRLSLARWLKCLYTAEREMADPRDIYARRYPHDLHKAVIVQKAAVGAGTLATALSNTPEALASAFVRLATPFTIIGRLGPKRVPFSVPIHSGTPPTSFAWTGEGLPRPAAKLTYTAGDALLPLTAGGIIVVSRELLKHAVTGSEDALLADLRDAYVAWLDKQFCDPAVAASAGVSPGSITNAVAAPIASGGGTPADAIEDLRSLHALYVSGGGKVEAAAILMSSANAVALALADPQRFGTLTRSGGTLGGLPVVASDAVGAQVVMVDTSQVIQADNGEADLNITRQADVEMLDSSLVQDGTAGTGASLVSLWQSAYAGIRVERRINWRAPAGAVQLVTGAYYYSAGSPL